MLRALPFLGLPATAASLPVAADAKCAILLPPNGAADCTALVPAARHPCRRHLQVLLLTLKKPHDTSLF